MQKKKATSTFTTNYKFILLCRESLQKMSPLWVFCDRGIEERAAVHTNLLTKQRRKRFHRVKKRNAIVHRHATSRCKLDQRLDKVEISAHVGAVNGRRCTKIFVWVIVRPPVPPQYRVFFEQPCGLLFNLISFRAIVKEAKTYIS